MTLHVPSNIMILCQTVHFCDSSVSQWSSELLSVALVQYCPMFQHWPCPPTPNPTHKSIRIVKTCVFFFNHSMDLYVQIVSTKVLVDTMRINKIKLGVGIHYSSYLHLIHSHTHLQRSPIFPRSKTYHCWTWILTLRSLAVCWIAYALRLGSVSISRQNIITFKFHPSHRGCCFSLYYGPFGFWRQTFFKRVLTSWR